MSSTRPNIIIITTDQQRTDSLSCYGSAFTSTPNLDRMAEGGVLLERAYCTNPVCTPSRVSIFTGQQVSRHGVWNVGMNAFEDTRMISHRLGDVGYRTHYIGKMHFQAFGGEKGQSVETMDGWEELYPEWAGPYYGFESIEIALGHTLYGIAGHFGSRVKEQVSAEEFESYPKACRQLSNGHFGGDGFEWDLPLQFHNSVWTADRTISFLEKHDRDQPFLLAIGFQDPHHPHAVPNEYEDRVSPQDVPLPDFDEGELDDKPPHFLEAHTGRLEDSEMRGDYYIAGQGAGSDFRKVNEQETRDGRACYHSMVRLIDREMGRILDCLDRTGLDDNTLIFFTSDHGELLGDHGLWMKGPFHYEQLIRVPMIVRWPEGIPGGRKEQGLFSLVDIVPTALTAAGLELDESVDGVNSLPLLRGESKTRDDVLVECIDDPNKLRLKTIVTENRKLTWYRGQSYGELYDLENDPCEKVNHWNNPDYAADKSDLLTRIPNHLESLEPRAERYSYA